MGPNFEANDTTTLWSKRRNAADCRLRGNMFLLDELAKMLMDLASRQLKLVQVSMQMKSPDPDPRKRKGK